MAKEPTFKEKILDLFQSRTDALDEEARIVEDRIRELQSKLTGINIAKVTLNGLSGEIEEMPQRSTTASNDDDA